MMWDPFRPPACPATVSLPTFARESVSAPFQVLPEQILDPSYQRARVNLFQSLSAFWLNEFDPLKH
jgi:hypothetical protein